MRPLGLPGTDLGVEGECRGRRRGARWAVVLLLLAASAGQGVADGAESEPNPRLTVFRAWLDREHGGYGCDEGPAPFRNRAVDAAYPGQRFFYVLTYTRGIPPPYAKSLSLVAAIDDSERVIPFRPGSPGTYRRGLKRVSSKTDAKTAAAALLTLASCDPAGRRWAYTPESFKVKKDSKGWKCTYRYDKSFESWVRFDRAGTFQEFGGSAPPVP